MYVISDRMYKGDLRGLIFTSTGYVQLQAGRNGRTQGRAFGIKRPLPIGDIYKILKHLYKLEANITFN